MASKRSARGAPSPAWQQRNQRARALGYDSYYDYRIHDYGRIPAAQAPPPRGSESRSRLRGHRSAADLERSVSSGSLVSVLGHSSRDPRTGRYRWVDVVLVDERTGRERTFRLKGQALNNTRLSRLVKRLEKKGAVLSPTPSLDLRRV